MNSERVSFAALVQAHAGVTALRAKAAGSVLVIHDTTTFEFRHADPEDVGYLNTSKPGFLAHYSLVVEPGARRPLGIGHLEPVFRAKKPASRRPGGAKSRKRSAWETARRDDRESLRWSRGFAATTELLDGCDVIHVADREGDNYELLGQAVQHGQRFIIRARVTERAVYAEGEKDTLVKLAGYEEGWRAALSATRKRRRPPRLSINR